MYPNIIYITDCTDPNAVARLSARFSALTDKVPTIVPLTGTSANQAAGLILLDTLQATEFLGESPRPIVVILNIAPRDGKWPNGAPFGFFWHNGHLIISTLNPEALALTRRHLGIKKIFVTDIKRVLKAASSWTDIGTNQSKTITDTQFRSLLYVPLLCKWLCDGREIPSDLQDIPADDRDSDLLVSFVDNFGNCKLNRPLAEIGVKPGEIALVRKIHNAKQVGLTVRCYERLTEVPQGESGLVRGSSGIDFAELVVGCGSAASRFRLDEGSALEITTAA